MGSRGSVIPFFNKIKNSGIIPITDSRMTRFMISLEQAVQLVWHALEDMVGGEIYVKKIPSMKMTELGRAIAPDAVQNIIGIRPGEKLHEQMIGVEDAISTYEFDEYFKILPIINGWSKDKDRIKNGKLVKPDFVYSSETNKDWMTNAELINWLDINKHKIGMY